MHPFPVPADLTNELSSSRILCAQGASCGVYLSTWSSQKGETQVAIKVFRIASQARSNDSTKLSKRLLDEMFLWSLLDHQHILPLYGMHMIGDVPGLVSPCCKNGDIVKCLFDLRGPAKFAVAMELVEQVAVGLEYLHTHDPVIVHGDLKGANILISDDGRALLCDFGLAEIRAAASETNFAFRSSASAKGTYRWMAFEFTSHYDAQLTRESDIWAFGCVLVEVLSGRVPFHEITPAPKGQVPSRPPGIHDRLWRLMLHCWQMVPSDRPCAGCILEKIRALPPTDHWDESVTSGWISGLVTTL